ncbi:hypothetical protein HRE53_13095 [Acaryochloris sp. 'Moss Beach']|uniref:hypothetical protein n=1 Tax=Acaryochloris sp. 'Moss Beach' TaxID=2740837 RepID=UPI001F475DE4|nr:hypothetical protein [Acaryochloris sp. 'Moss Beach']UJB67636.1 hypothetical protein HRE53_13095 [Acaryochloris sp. 'Moss Beach']
MKSFNKGQAIEYTANLGWTKADAKRAVDNLPFPIDEIAILNALVRFAGPELLERQRKQAAQKALVTKKAKMVKDLSQQFEHMVDDYEAQIQDDRSAFVTLLKTLYGIAQRFGYQDNWIDSLLATYAQYTKNGQDEAA